MLAVSKLIKYKNAPRFIPTASFIRPFYTMRDCKIAFSFNANRVVITPSHLLVRQL